MSTAKKPTAIEKRAQNLEALTPFALVTLKQKLPLVFPRALDLSPSPKPRYRSAYRYLGFDDLNEETLETFLPSKSPSDCSTTATWNPSWRPTCTWPRPRGRCLFTR